MAEQANTSLVARVRLQAAAATDVGRFREHNEDAFVVRPEVGLFAVADGMGGHESGDVASAIVAESMAGSFERPPNGDRDSMTEFADAELPSPAARLLCAVRRANRDVHLASLEGASRRGMGSTIVALHVSDCGRVAFVGHVGDSRCYRIRNGSIELLTEDHSLANEARALDPSLSEEDLARMPSNIITRALGLEADVRVDLREIDVRPRDVFLLCSDGLSGLISSEQMLEAVRIADGPEEATELLVALANDGGGYDNITAVVVAANE